MLPFTKRPQRRHDVVDTLSSGDVEVVHASIANTILTRAPASPSIFERESSDDDDRTLLMSSKTKSTPPQAFDERTPIRKPVAPPTLKGLVRRRMDTEDHTLLRPKSAMAAESPAPKPKSKSPAMMPTPYMAMKPQQLPVVVPRSAKPLRDAPSAALAKSDATKDARLDIPAAVITQRTLVVPPKRSWSWGAGLIGLGIAAGLAAAIVARGDADSLIDATARFVDPSGAYAAGATPQTLAPIAMAPAAALTAPASACGSDPAHPFSSTPVMMAAQPATQAALPPVAIAPPPKLPDPSLAKPEPPRPAPVAWAAPARSRAHASQAAVQHPSQERAETDAPAPAAAPPPPAPRAQVATAKPATTKSAAAPKGNEMESASAADALAKAQLEASLR